MAKKIQYWEKMVENSNKNEEKLNKIEKIAEKQKNAKMTERIAKYNF